MSKINKKITIITSFLILVVVAGLFIKMPVNTSTPAPESQVGGMVIQFKDGISEPEIKAILQNINTSSSQNQFYSQSLRVPKIIFMIRILD